MPDYCAQDAAVSALMRKEQGERVLEAFRKTGNSGSEEFAVFLGGLKSETLTTNVVRQMMKLLGISIRLNEITWHTELSGYPAEWSRANAENLLRLRFTIDDNDFLDKEYVEQLKREYTGVFFERFVLGKWVIAEGLVYRFDAKTMTTDRLPERGDWYVSVDYGTLNPFSEGLWRIDKGVATRVREYYHSGRDTNDQRTDEEYYAELERLTDGLDIECIIVDPSSASFITTIRRHGRFTVRKANNNVLDVVRCTATLLQQGRVLIHGVSFLFWNVDRLHVFPLTEFAPLWDESTGALLPTSTTRRSAYTRLTAILRRTPLSRSPETSGLIFTMSRR